MNLGQTSNSRVSLLKNKRIIVLRMELFVGTFKKVHASLLPTIELLGSTLDMYVKPVMVLISHGCVVKNQI